ncbi:UNVERIFIED_CONTAM: hypothetical protein GTU68_049277 [Idotea baltica]|nr:hypothetical protein [Idotea baltica]
MTGRLMPSINEDEKKYVSFCFSLNKNRKIFFKDVRKFGKIGFYKDSNYLENKLGLEPLSKDLNFKSLKEILTNKKRIIKALLLDQKYIAGLGNIYVDEALWYARINPKEISNKITDKQIKDLCTGIKKILKKSIDNNGTSFISFKYAEDKEGNFAEKLSVFNRKDKPCKRCKTKIKKTVVSQRGTHFCKECQKFN